MLYFWQRCDSVGKQLLQELFYIMSDYWYVSKDFRRIGARETRSFSTLVAKPHVVAVSPNY